MNLFNLLNVSTEDIKQSKANETEVVVYAKIGEFEGLKLADSKEDHIQLEGKFGNGVNCRVRKVTREEGVKFFFTYKLNHKTVGSAIDSIQEYTVEVDESFFEGFRFVATRELKKTRYNFKSSKVTLTTDQSKTIDHSNVNYEVDVYTKADGELSDWCKIDVEVDIILDTIEEEHPDSKDIKFTVKVKHLPFKPYESILAMNANDEQKLKLDDIWKEFVLPVSKPRIPLFTES
jgi:hypothetical protein